LSGSPITVYGDGRQKRCFCSVGDAIEALIGLPNVPEAAGTVVNVGSQEEVSILALAEQVKAICQSESEIVLVPYETAYGPGFDDMQRRVPDLTRVQELMGWKPRRSLSDIIQSVVDSFKASPER
jgi:UDP-glucose 4-epimerase